MQQVDYLIDYLLKENPQIKINKKASTPEEKFHLYRSLCNIREPKNIDEKYIQEEKKYLQEVNKKKKIQDIDNINTIDKTHPNNNRENPTKIAIWQGDITTLKIGAIVNAANSKGLGCFIPGHNCIDNQINTYAGIPLRLECNEHMKKINYNLPTGEAFLTKAYNLPANYVIHTVGPIIEQDVTPKKEQLLANCYTNCLKIARQNNIRNIAFCSISTGVFHFPKDLAAQIALKTVDEYLNKYTDDFDKIVFNVYSNNGVEVYERFI